MDSRKRIGIVIIITSLLLVFGHLSVVSDLIQRGVDPDQYAESGGTVLATRAAIPIGAMALSLGIILLFHGKRKQMEVEAAPDASAPQSWMASNGPLIIMTVGLAIILMHVVLLRDLAMHAEAMELLGTTAENDSSYVLEQARVAVHLERINAIYVIGLGVTFAGLILSFAKKSQSEAKEPE